jgi:hypothetical protein
MDRDALGAVSGGLSERDRGKPTCRPAETDPAIDTHAHNGLFPAAPRRTGKPTFLQADLKPALEAAGAVVAYVDLWVDPRRDPGSLIADAIARALAPRLGVVSRAAKAAVALIVDEARHALTSEAGDATMSALKPARDELNRPGEVNLMLVMSGSDRDKLLRLVNTNGAPFYGSQVSRMPPLGQDFIDHVSRLVMTQRRDLAPVDDATLFQTFESFRQRPLLFMEALGQALSPLSRLQGVSVRAGGAAGGQGTPAGRRGADGIRVPGWRCASTVGG